MILLPNYWMYHHLCQTSKPSTEYETIQSLESPPPISPNRFEQTRDDNNHQQYQQHRQQPWTVKDHFQAAMKIAPVWFISNWAYNASLLYTSITSSTVLASTGSLFTFLFALLLRDESFGIYKFLGVLLGMSGSILTGLHDAKESTSTSTTNTTTTITTSISIKDDVHNNNENVSSIVLLYGDILGLISAVGYGSYTVMVRVLCPRDESLMSMQLFLGFVGVVNCITLSPVALYQIFLSSSSSTTTTTASEITWVIFGCLIVKGLLDNVLSDYLWARAVVLTSATVATVGLGLTIPLAFLSDWMLGRSHLFEWTSIVGAVSVLLGFWFVNFGTAQVDDGTPTEHMVNVVAIAVGHQIDLEGDDLQQAMNQARINHDDDQASRTNDQRRRPRQSPTSDRMEVDPVLNPTNRTFLESTDNSEHCNEIT